MQTYKTIEGSFGEGLYTIAVYPLPKRDTDSHTAYGLCFKLPSGEMIFDCEPNGFVSSDTSYRIGLSKYTNQTEESAVLAAFFFAVTELEDFQYTEEQLNWLHSTECEYLAYEVSELLQDDDEKKVSR